VRIPETYQPERCYILHTLLGEFLGLSLDIASHSESQTVLEVAGHPGRLIVAEGLFRTPESLWLKPESLPSLPLRTWQAKRNLPEALLCEETLPIIYGDASPDQPLLAFGKHEARLNLDVFGSCFFMLTRYEELVLPDRDAHQRFPASASLAYRAGFLDRPIVNEYLEVLWAVMRRLWGFLQRKERSYRIVLTHDVDWPAVGYRVPWQLVLRGALGDLFERRALGASIRRIGAKLFSRFDIDPANTFDWLMRLSETHRLQGEFYFITDHTAGMRDGVYTLEDDYIRTLLRKLHERGHIVGLHPSYESYRCPEQIRREFERLQTTAQALGIEQARWGGRQHYLRWENPTTWQAWADAGLDYDSTLTYADHAGFRCGTCYEYPVFNLQTRQSLRLRERPLIVMERTLFDYMCLTPDKAQAQVTRLAQHCRRLGGEFVLLWHNSYLLARWHREFYAHILKALIGDMV
jgi:hypothetical protein